MSKKKRFVVWFHTNLANEIAEMCGSDSIQNVDNRLNNESIIRTVLNPENPHTTWMRKKKAIGFKIAEGTILKHRYITDLKRI